MSDDADIAQAQAEREEEMRNKFKFTLLPEAEATGKCLNCGEPLTQGRWCDVYCRNDWATRQRS